MKFDERTDRYTLSTGRVISANRGILGLNGDGTLYDGYDSTVESADYDPEWASDPKLTPEERREVAEKMVERWQKWGGLP